MPELPEVETVKRALEPVLAGRRIRRMEIICGSLRAPVRSDLPELVANRQVKEVTRRAKYILARFGHGTMGIHLGMSGTIRIEPARAALRKHDHVQWLLPAGVALRYHDPRRFGMVFWSDGDAEHERVANSGVEPLGPAFNAALLAKLCAATARPIKLLLMDSAKIAGIGNIYASEALFRARVSPLRPAKKLARPEAAALVRSCKAVLRAAIKAGGSSLRDHRYGDDRLGYFQLQHKVYGKAGESCPACSFPIARVVLGQRATFLCPHCQR
ncbi:MAG: bifunctional DNA-formamidopyrimidine glycosylase/DNA-(apurinic or apyrimidinic site) lyase [Betaproteobacteria bacterium AqS2]|uniref:Formamidopyrimidine-DNA glycosylase n=1 Tax=Candidatus Amphirhobacter heronislandensis TaxID=1732024 RepID=A0A930UGZ7_9GAMM|nr:bifunctional DNA-formamidopyrimidine glycosylase/DNA-(apurinic or apyrimidinic site) lyase [Betaproteobacteria bacterium AqS2]